MLHSSSSCDRCCLSQADKLKQLDPARCLTYVQLFSLSEKQLQTILARFPAEAKRVRTAALWMSLRRGLLWCVGPTDRALAVLCLYFGVWFCHRPPSAVSTQRATRRPR